MVKSFGVEQEGSSFLQEWEDGVCRVTLAGRAGVRERPGKISLLMTDKELVTFCTRMSARKDFSLEDFGKRGFYLHFTSRTWVVQDGLHGPEVTTGGLIILPHLLPAAPGVAPVVSAAEPATARRRTSAPQPEPLGTLLRARGITLRAIADATGESLRKVQRVVAREARSAAIESCIARVLCRLPAELFPVPAEKAA